MDKARVFGSAIKYMEYLEQRVQKLEEEAAVSADQNRSIGQEEEGWHEQTLPDITARISDNTLLLRIQCEKRKGIVVNILAEVDKLNLTILNLNVAPFGTSALDVTIVLKMDEELNLSTQDVVTALRSALHALS